MTFYMYHQLINEIKFYGKKQNFFFLCSYLISLKDDFLRCWGSYRENISV